MNAEDTKLIRLLFLIKKRPLLYLECRSIWNLSDFYGGFIGAVMTFMPENQCGKIINEFGSFIVNKHPELEYMGLFYILDEVAGHDEEKAFDLFYSEFESFLTKEGIGIPC